MERLLTIKEVMDILNVSKRTLQRWDNNGTLPAVRTIGGHRRYNESDILFFRNKNEPKNALNDFTDDELITEITRRLKKSKYNWRVNNAASKKTNTEYTSRLNQRTANINIVS